MKARKRGYCCHPVDVIQCKGLGLDLEKPLNFDTQSEKKRIYKICQSFTDVVQAAVYLDRPKSKDDFTHTHKHKSFQPNIFAHICFILWTLTSLLPDGRQPSQSDCEPLTNVKTVQSSDLSISA